MRPRAFLYAAAAGTAVGLVMLFVQYTGGQPYLLVPLLAVLASIPVLRRLLGGRFDVFEPVVLFSFLVLFLYVAVPLILIQTGDITPDAYFNHSLVMVTVSAVAFYAGYGYAGPLGRLFGAPRAPSPGGGRLRLYVVILLLFAASLSFYLILMGSIGGVKFYLENMMHARNALREGKGYLVLLSQFLMLVTFLTAYSFKERLSTVFVALLTLATGFVTLSFGSIGDGLLFLIVIVIFNYYRNRRFGTLRLLAACGLLFAAVISLRYYRELTAVAEFGEVFSDGVFLWFVRYFDTLPMLMAVMEHVPEAIPYQAGKTLWYFLQFFLPRAVFPDKTNGMGEFLTRELFPQVHEAKVTFAFPLVAEGYLNFGLAGVVLLSLALGGFYRLLYLYIQKSGFSSYSLGVYAVSLFNLYPFVRAGLFDFPMFTYLFVIILYTAAMKTAGIRIVPQRVCIANC